MVDGDGAHLRKRGYCPISLNDSSANNVVDDVDASAKICR